VPRHKANERGSARKGRSSRSAESMKIRQNDAVMARWRRVDTRDRMIEEGGIVIRESRRAAGKYPGNVEARAAGKCLGKIETRRIQER
jgi:hypothetical protein